jgi:hypothetical protein
MPGGLFQAKVAGTFVISPGSKPTHGYPGMYHELGTLSQDAEDGADDMKDDSAL